MSLMNTAQNTMLGRPKPLEFRNKVLFDRRLGSFRVQIRRDDEDLPEAKLTASVLAPPHLTEHERSSGIPSTVELSTPFPEPKGITLPGDQNGAG